jgi:hypothetical protein
MEAQQLSDNKAQLVLIPDEELTEKQKELAVELLGEDYGPIYTFSQEPKSLGEIGWREHLPIEDPDVMIWRENETFTFVTDDNRSEFSSTKRSFAFALFLGEKYHRPYFHLSFRVLGKADAAVLETATFFCSVRHPEHPKAYLRFHQCLPEDEGNLPFNVDFAALRGDQLTNILESNLSRQVELEIGSWSPEQAKILATQPFPLNLKLNKAHEGETGIESNDDGTEFINHLETRRTRFGSLAIGGIQFDMMSLSRSNLERIMNLEGAFDKLTIGLLNRESFFLPFSAKVGALDYRVHGNSTQPNNFDSLDIATNDIKLTFELDETDPLEELLISFCNRMTQLAHFERLGISVEGALRQSEATESASVVQAIIRTIDGNPDLTQLSLDLCRSLFLPEVNMEKLFQAIGRHRRLRIVELYPFPPVTSYRIDDEAQRLRKPYFSMLETLLDRNKFLSVLDYSGKRITNRTTIDDIYVKNYIDTRFIKEAKEHTFLRPFLVASALTQRASIDFQYSAELMTFHTDILCELLHDVHLDDSNHVLAAAGPAIEETEMRFSNAFHQATDHLKRKREQ